MAEPTRRAGRPAAPTRSTGPGRPAERRGTPGSGRIVTLLTGQSYGFIRLADGRNIFFHRSDVREGVSFNALAVGDRVTFELLEDPVSGPRATQVGPRQRGQV